MNWGPGRYNLDYSEEQVEALRSSRENHRELLEEMIRSNFPVGTKFRSLWCHRKDINNPDLHEPTFVIVDVCLLGYEHIVYLMEAEQAGCLVFKELDTLGRPNGRVKSTSPDSFGEFYEVIKT